MDEFVFKVNIKVEGSDKMDAEDNLRDLMDADPVIIEYDIEQETVSV